MLRAHSSGTQQNFINCFPLLSVYTKYKTHSLSLLLRTVPPRTAGQHRDHLTPPPSPPPPPFSSPPLLQTRFQRVDIAHNIIMCLCGCCMFGFLWAHSTTCSLCNSDTQSGPCRRGNTVELPQIMNVLHRSSDAK